jgi:iron complex outermembrane receptor protein
MKNRVRCATALLSVVILAVAGAAFAQPASPPGALALPDLDVVATAPVAGSGTGINRAKIPGTVETMSAEDIARGHSSSVVDLLGQRIPGASLNDVQGNELTQDLRYRGFAASPLQGTPQGLAVYQNGARINEAFGDTLNWDLVLPIAIRNIDVFTNNPIFGLNAIGGAVNIEMKNGFTYQGFEGTVRGGSYGRVGGVTQYGMQSGPWAVYIAGDIVRDGGWRYQSDSRVGRIYADLGYRGPASELHLVVSGAMDDLGVIGPTPIQLTSLNPRAIFTWPQTTKNEVGSIAANGTFNLSDTWTLQTNLYARRFYQRHLDGNVGDFETCSARSSFSGQICLQDDAIPTPAGGKTTAFRNQFVILGPNGASFPFIAGTPYGTVDYTTTRTTTLGGSAQLTNTDQLFGHGNTFLVGASIDYSNLAFSSSTTLGYLFPDLFVGPNAGVPGTGIGPIRTFGNVGFAPVNVAGRISYLGLYVSDIFDLTERLALSVGGRLNVARIETDDTSGTAPELNGSHSYTRFNPFAGLTFAVTPEVSLYVGYSEANRTPTPLELSCSDPLRPCLLANSLVADPSLKQVVAHTYEAGARGTSRLASDGKLTWKFGLFRTDSDDDIIALASAIQGRGYFANVPGTRRQGIEAAVQYQSASWLLYANYTLVDATFQFTGLLASPNNPSADANGNILVRSGNRIPLVPLHQFKAGASYFFTPKWELGADIIVYSNQFYAGDEANQNKQLPAYWATNVHSSYQFTEHLQVFADIRNLFNRRYAIYGTYSQPNSVANAIPVALNDPRTVTLAQPLSIYGGIKMSW